MLLPALFFADLNHTAEIKNPGMGLVSTGFEADETIRISGKGYRRINGKSFVPTICYLSQIMIWFEPLMQSIGGRIKTTTTHLSQL